MVLTGKSLFRLLVSLRDGSDVQIPDGVHTAPDGRPVLYVWLRCAIRGGGQVSRLAASLLALAETNPELAEAEVGRRLKIAIVSPIPTGGGARTRPFRMPAVIVPVIRRAEDAPSAILACLLTTGASTGDCLADRICRCRVCGDFFLSKTRKRSAHCSSGCRRLGRRNQ